MTLPESTLERLESIDMDRARAIVKLTDAAMPLDSRAQKKIDIVEVAPGLGIIIVSSDLEEVIAASDRILVMSEGHGVAEFDQHSTPATVQDILNAAFKVMTHD